MQEVIVATTKVTNRKDETKGEEFPKCDVVDIVEFFTLVIWIMETQLTLQQLRKVGLSTEGDGGNPEILEDEEFKQAKLNFGFPSTLWKHTK